MTCITLPRGLEIHKNGAVKFPAAVRKALNAAGFAKGWRKYRWPAGSRLTAVVNNEEQILVLRVTEDEKFSRLMRFETSADAWLRESCLPTVVAHYEPKTEYVALLYANRLLAFGNANRHNENFRAFEMDTPTEGFVDDPSGVMTLFEGPKQVRGIKNRTKGRAIPLAVLDAAGVVWYSSVSLAEREEPVPPIFEALGV